MNGRMRPKAGDLIILCVTLLLAAASFLLFRQTRPTAVAVAVVVSDGETVGSIRLPAENARIDLPDKDVLVCAEGNEVWVAHSDCPDQICVRGGKIDKPGQSLVCLPNRVVVKITGAAQLDAVVG